MGTNIQITEVEIPKGKELLEDVYFGEFALMEDADGKKKPYLKGKFGQADIPTANKRVYPRKVMESQFRRIEEAMNNRQMYGELDHPGDGKTKAARVSHLIYGLSMQEDGQFDGVCEIIPGTINGDQALAILRAGGRLGISSRGFGTTVPDHKGNHIVQEDYHLVAFDMVVDPANAGAFPDYVVEDKEVLEMDLATLKKDHSDLVEALEGEIKEKIETEARTHARDALREEFEDKLQTSADEVRSEVEESVREELMADPEVAGSSVAMKQVARLVAPFVLKENEGSVIADLEKRVQEAERKLAKADEEKDKAIKEATELAELAKEAFFHLYLEQELHGDERREQIEGVLGDVTVFESLEDLKERVEEIVTALSEEDEVKEEYEREIKKLKAQAQRLQEQLETSLTVGNQFAAKAYIERKLANHPRAEDVRGFLDEAEPMTQDEVDRLVEAFDARNPVSDEFSKIRKGLNKDDNDDGKQKLGEARQLQAIDGGKVLGVNIGELAEEAGLTSEG